MPAIIKANIWQPSFNPGSKGLEQEVKRWRRRDRVGNIFVLPQRGDVSLHPGQEQHRLDVLAEAEQGGAAGAPGGEHWPPSLSLEICLEGIDRQVRELPGYQFASPTPKSMKEVTFIFGAGHLKYTCLGGFQEINEDTFTFKGWPPNASQFSNAL